MTSLWAAAQTPGETYKLKADLQSAIEQDTTAWKYQTAAVNYSFVGDHKNTLATWDKAVQSRKYSPTAADTALLQNAELKNARDYIVNRAKEEQIIIINEAHHNPMHRRFTASLLKGLYEQGYRYLGLEAIEDSAINTRNYAVKKSGYYTQEPEFAQLIYEARKLGFLIFDYEATEDKNGKEREIEQAQHIQQFMKAHPGEKMIIHCGFDHVYEAEVRNWEKAMAGRLKEFTGIDPFTIDQVKFSEKSSPDFSHYLVYATKETEPFVLIDQHASAFRGISTPLQTDLVVIHPITRYIQERPHWRTGGRNAYQIPKSSAKTYPIQVLAYRSGEEQDGIPVDMIELGSEKDKKPLYLPPGRYTIVSRDKQYKTISKRSISLP